jgi:outer membrane lipoprotein carrier protein
MNSFQLPLPGIPRVRISFLLAALLALASTLHMQAQDATALLTKLSNKAKTYSTIEAAFKSTLIDTRNNLRVEQRGTIFLKGKRYQIDLGDFVVVSDGVTVWTYEKEMNECYIENAADMEQDGIDPAKLFTIWEDNFRSELKGKVNIGGVNCTQINLYPKGSEKRSFHTIQLFVDEAKLQVVRVIVKGREGSDVQYDVTKFTPNVALADDRFKFNKAKYPGVKMVDNRL